jgi:hypothetical protein
MLSDEQIIKYQALYENYYGKEISREQASEQGMRLIRLFKVLYGPISEDEYKELRNKCKTKLN